MRRRLASVRRRGTQVALTLSVEAPMGRRTLSVRVPLSLYAEAGEPLEGESVSEETYRLLFLEEDRMECRRRAARIQGISPNSENALLQKLALRGFPRDVAEEAIGALVSLGYLDESDQLSRLVELAAKKYWPRKKTVLALLRKGYRREDILSHLDLVGYSDAELARRLVAAKLPLCATDEETQLLLARYGFRQEE